MRQKQKDQQKDVGNLNGKTSPATLVDQQGLILEASEEESEEEDGRAIRVVEPVLAAVADAGKGIMSDEYSVRAICEVTVNYNYKSKPFHF